MAFSASDTAFEGFRLARRAPLAMVTWALVYVALLVLFFLLASGSIISLMAIMAETQGEVEPGSEAFNQIMRAYAGMAWLLPVSLVFSAVLYAAVNRAVLEPEAKRLGYMRLGMDEVRVLAVTVVLTILGGIAAMVVFGVAGLVGGFAAAAAGDLGGLIMVLVLIAALGFMIWLALRFSLAVPITMGEKKIAIFDSWNVTRGRTLGLLGMAAIAFVMAFVVSILVSIIILPLSLLGIGGIEQLAGMEGVGLAEVMATMGPALVVYLIFNSIVSALMLAIIYAPFAAAYRDITGRTAIEAA